MMTKQSEWDGVQKKQRKTDKAEMRKRDAADKLQRRLESHRAARSEVRAASDSEPTLMGFVNAAHQSSSESLRTASAGAKDDEGEVGDSLAEEGGGHIAVLVPGGDPTAEESEPAEVELSRLRVVWVAFLAGVRAHVIEEWRSVVVFVLFFLWVGVGVIYGMLVEKWSFCTAFYFAVTSMSTGGLQGPTAGEGGRNMLFVGVYCLVGVPMFGAFVGSLGSSFFTIIFRRTDETPISTLDMYSREVRR